MGDGFNSKTPDVDLLGKGWISSLTAFRSLHKIVYIIFVHKLQKTVFSVKFLDNPGKLNYD